MKGDIFILEKHMIHIFGENLGIQYALFDVRGFLVIKLPIAILSTIQFFVYSFTETVQRKISLQ